MQNGRYFFLRRTCLARKTWKSSAWIWLFKSGIHRLNHFQQISNRKTNWAIHWIEIYLVDSIQWSHFEGPFLQTIPATRRVLCDGTLTNGIVSWPTKLYSEGRSPTQEAAGLGLYTDTMIDAEKGTRTRLQLMMWQRRQSEHKVSPKEKKWQRVIRSKVKLTIQNTPLHNYRENGC